MDESNYNPQEFLGNISNIQYITGPSTLSILTNNNCTIINIGDIHIHTNNGFDCEENKSIYLPEYLNYIFKKFPDKQFDVMLELKYTKNKLDDYLLDLGIINNTYKYFLDCFVNINDKIKCNKNYPNVRFHNIDIRYLYENNETNNFTNLLHRIKFIINLIRNIQETNAQNIRNQVYEYIPDFIENKDNIINYISNLIISYYKFERYQSLDFIDIVNEYIIERLYTIVTFKNTLRKFLKKKYNDIETIKILHDFLSFIRDVSSLILDYYVIIRYMKILSYGSKNIIYIAGDSHIDNFEIFLRNKNINMDYVLYKNKFILPLSKQINNHNTIIKLLNYIGYDTTYIQKTFSYNIEEMYILLKRALDYSLNNNVKNNILQNINNSIKTYEDYLNINQNNFIKIITNSGARYISFTDTENITDIEKYIK